MRDIRKTFPGVVALDKMRFELRNSEVHVLLGENGAGKSTLMKILSGAYRKDGGEIFINGEKVEIKNPRQAQGLGIGIIYQEFNLVPSLSIAENIFLGREPCNIFGVIDFKKMHASAQKCIDELGGGMDSRQFISELGVAKQQMVEVAKALSLEAKILIMDEPTSALTEHEIEELFATIRRLKARAVSIIYISHRMEEIFTIGDRVTVLRDGVCIGTHEIGKISQPDLIREMVGRKLEEQYPKQRSEVGEKILEVKNLTIKGKLDSINFTLRRGETLGIAGLMGSGRTSLARAILGIDKIDSGEIRIHEKTENVASPRQAINQGFGYLSEDRKSQGLVLVLSVKNNICLPSVERFSRYGVMRTDMEKLAGEHYINKLHIKTTGLNQETAYLSGGNQQKVVLGKWLCTEAEILIFDEPTRGIDVGSKVEIYKIMNELTSRGVSIIMISSELPEILGMSDRILIMNNGRLVKELPVSEATQETILEFALAEKDERVAT